MHKQILERFINKYNLNGSIESITWKCVSKNVKVAACDPEKNLLAMVSTDLDLPDGNYDIHQTSDLKALLGVLDGDITVSVKEVNNKPKSFLITDGQTKITFGLSENDIITKVPGIKVIPTPEIMASIDVKFIQRYIKACSALSHAENFAIVSDGNTTDLIVNYAEKQNTNRVLIPLTVSQHVKLPTTYYSAERMNNVLQSNKEATGTLNITSTFYDGFMDIAMTLPGYTLNYYLLGRQPK